MTAVAGAGFMGLLQAILGRNSCVGQNTCPKLPEARARQAFPLCSVYFVAMPGGAFLLWWVETQTMAGTHSLEEVLGMLDTVDEPICDGSDDDFDTDFDTDYLNYDDQDMTSKHILATKIVSKYMQSISLSNALFTVGPIVTSSFSFSITDS